MPLRLPRLMIAALIGCVVTAGLSAKPDMWTGPDGKDFRGEPAMLVGPVAVFKTGKGPTRRVPLSSLSPEQCVRFHHALAALPARAPTWQAATSAISKDLLGGLYRLENKNLVRIDLTARAEPEFYLMLYCSHNDGTSWQVVDAVLSAYPDLKKKSGDAFEAIFVGRGHDANQHRRMAEQKNMPWPITDYHAQRQMTHVMEFAPANAPLLALVSRNGTLLQAVSTTKYEDYVKSLAEIGQLLAAREPNFPAGWAHRLHYMRAVQPVLHKDGTCGPEMLGHPLNLEVLRTHGITRIEAQVAVGADGAVKSVTVQQSETITQDFASVLEPAIAKAPFVPAVDHGRFVDGMYHFMVDTAPEG